MCVSIPGQITDILDSTQRIALVDISGQPRTINLGLLTADEGTVGDWVLVHAGLAISRVDATDAHTILTMLQAYDQLNQEERL
jgi:hydrogenase expression/formation protein HypC